MVAASMRSLYDLVTAGPAGSDPCGTAVGLVGSHQDGMTWLAIPGW